MSNILELLPLFYQILGSFIMIFGEIFIIRKGPSNSLEIKDSKSIHDFEDAYRRMLTILSFSTIMMGFILELFHKIKIPTPTFTSMIFDSILFIWVALFIFHISKSREYNKEKDSIFRRTGGIAYIFFFPFGDFLSFSFIILMFFFFNLIDYELLISISLFSFIFNYLLKMEMKHKKQLE